MATLAEIQQREEELRQAQLENQQVASQSIPVRKFGAGVSVKEQRQAIERKQIAEQNIQQIEQQKQQLQQVRNEITSNTQRANEQIQNYEVARKLAARGGRKLGSSELRSLGFNREQREYYSDIYEGNLRTTQYINTLKKAKEQGLTPVISNGKIVGFLDEQRLQSVPLDKVPQIASEDSSFAKRAEAAGIISTVQTKPTLSEQINRQSFANPEDKFAVQSNVPTPPETFRQRVQREVGEPLQRKFIEQGGNKSPSAAAFTLAAIAGQEIYKRVQSKEFKQAAFQRSYDTSSPILPSNFRRGQAKVSAGIQTFIIETGGVILLPKSQSEVKIFAATAVLFPIAQTFPKYVFTPLSVGLGGATLFNLFNPKRKNDLTLPEAFGQGIVGGLLVGGGLFSPTKFQRFQLQEYAKITALESSNTITPATANALRKGVQLAGDLRKFTDIPVRSKLTEAIPQELTILEKEVFVQTLERPELYEVFGSQSTRLRKLQEPGGDIDAAFKKNKQVLQETTESLKEVSNQKVLQRGEAVGIGEEKAFDIKDVTRVKEFGGSLKPVRTLDDRPISRAAEQMARTISGTNELRKGGKDIGQVLIISRRFIEQERFLLDNNNIPFVREIKQIRLARAERRLFQFEKALPEISSIVKRTGESEIAKEALDLTPFKIETNSPIVQFLENKKGNIKLPFFFERLESKVVVTRDPLGRFKTLSITEDISGTRLRDITTLTSTKEPRVFTSSDIEIIKIRSKALFASNLPSNIDSSNIRTSQIKPSELKPLISVSNISPSKLDNKPNTSKIPSSVINSIVPVTRITPSPNLPVPPGFPGLGKSNDRKVLKFLDIRSFTKSSTSRGFRTFVIRDKKKFYLGGIAPKGKALRKGQEVALKSLRATFGVEQTSTIVTGNDLQFNPTSAFRGYRIKKGQKIPLDDIYIQKRGKRLASIGEREEIKLARIKY